MSKSQRKHLENQYFAKKTKETLGNIVEGVKSNVLKREHSEAEIPKLKPKRQKRHKKIKKKNYIW